MAEITLLDGGMGQELVHRSGKIPTPLWATQIMVDHPGLVAEVHRAFAEAGATLATTNTYAVHHDRFVGTHLEGKLQELVALALGEVAAVRGAGRIAGAIGPLVASYRPDLHPPHEVAVPLYAELATLLASHVDLILCESVASVDHAKAVLEGARAACPPVWLSVTVDDLDGTVLRPGEPVAMLKDLHPDAWLANCSAPEAMAAALKTFAAFGKPFGAYANGFNEITKDFLAAKPTVDSLSRRRDMGPEVYAGFVMDWVGMGATIVGGCCEIGPDHIRAIRDAVEKAGHVIV